MHMTAAVAPLRSLVVVLALLVGACSPPQPSSSNGRPNYRAYESVPTRSFWISVERSATKQFHEQLEHLSKRNSMGMWMSVTSPDQQNFSIAIQGDQLQIIAVNDAQLYEVAYYSGKAKPISAENLDKFISDMKSDLGQIGGVTFPTFSKRPYPT